MEDQYYSSAVEPTDDWHKYDPKYRSAADYLGVNVNTEWSHWKPRLDYLIDWAVKKADSNEPSKVVLALDGLSKEIGPHAFDDKKIAHIYRHLRLKEKEVPIKGSSKKEIIKKDLAPENAIITEVASLIKTVNLGIRQALKEANNWKDNIQ